MLKQNCKPYARERRFVDVANKVAQRSQNGEVVLFAYNSYQALVNFSERCRAGDLEARKLWDKLPEKIRNFWPALNYLNQKGGK